MRKALAFISLAIIICQAVQAAPDTQIYNAILVGDTAKVKAYLAKNPEAAKERGKGGITLLHLAAGYGQKDIAELLINHKADVNAKSDDGVTPLSMAMIMNQAEMVRFLIEHGAKDSKEGPQSQVAMPSYSRSTGQGYKAEAPRRPTSPIRFERKPGIRGTKAVTFQSITANGCPVNVIRADLKDSRVRVEAAITANGIGYDEPFSSFIKRHKPVAAINGTFFSKGNLRPIGDIVIDGQLVFFGGMGTGICVTKDCQVDFVEAVRARHTDWSDYETVVCCGPRLLENGKIVVDPQREGFRDPHVLGKANRTGVGLTPDGHLIFANTKKGVSLKQWAAIMKSLGCTEAVNFDGGASMAMYYRGKTISNPGRKLTNVLMIFEE